MEYVLHTVGHLVSPWAAVFRVLVALLSWTEAVVTRAGGWRSGRDRFTVSAVSTDWLREYRATATKHRDIV